MYTKKRVLIARENLTAALFNWDDFEVTVTRERAAYFGAGRLRAISGKRQRLHGNVSTDGNGEDRTGPDG